MVTSSLLSNTKLSIYLPAFNCDTSKTMIICVFMKCILMADKGLLDTYISLIS